MSDSNNINKLFKDTVHGYIPVPKRYCDNIIDTSIFQRLRRIEQTSMRTLFPCAHHDRFVHSLGTFHLGSMVLKSIENNSQNILKDWEEWIKLKNTFEVACLLHDCGHSPFSHSFEKYFDMPPQLDTLLIETVGGSDKNFCNDINNNPSKPHEKISAYLLLKNTLNLYLQKK